MCVSRMYGTSFIPRYFRDSRSFGIVEDGPTSIKTASSPFFITQELINFLKPSLF